MDKAMTKWFMTAIVLSGIYCGSARAGAGAEREGALRPDGGKAVSLEGYDIDRVVEAVAKAMSDAARGYYLPDRPENSRAIKLYAKDSRKIILMNTAFKRELAQVCLDVAKAAANAGRDTEMLPGRPLVLPSGLAPVPVGVSSITVSTEEDTKVVFTNTMPCIDAAARALHGATLRQFPETASAPAAEKIYTRKFGSILTANRLYNHVLAGVCSKLVGFAKKTSEQ